MVEWDLISRGLNHHTADLSAAEVALVDFGDGEIVDIDVPLGPSQP